MGLKEQLEADQREAMRSGHTLRLGTIRMLRTAIQNAEQARRKTLTDALLEQKRAERGGGSTDEPEDDAVDVSDAEIAEIARRAALSDQEIVDTVVAREVKQRRDSIEQFRKAGRQDLLDREEGELHVLLAYQPEQLTDVEVEALVRAVIAELGAQGPRDQGKVMGRLASQLRGKADLGAVGKLVQRLLAG
jgi:uncharacterized protein YqeY